MVQNTNCKNQCKGGCYTQDTKQIAIFKRVTAPQDVLNVQLWHQQVQLVVEKTFGLELELATETNGYYTLMGGDANCHLVQLDSEPADITPTEERSRAFLETLAVAGLHVLPRKDPTLPTHLPYSSAFQIPFPRPIILGIHFFFGSLPRFLARFLWPGSGW